MSSHLAVGDVPDISSSSYGTSTYTPNEGVAGVGWGGVVPGTFTVNTFDLVEQFRNAGHGGGGRAGTAGRNIVRSGVRPIENQPQEQALSTRRLVQVYVADPDEQVPLEKSILYAGEQKLTDATDQELFFEIDIHAKLKAHNELRGKIIDKGVKERTEYLEPIKIRDLKMVVVNIATF